MTSGVEGDLNNVIAAAVNARVQAEVMAALAGDEVISQYVAAALQQTVEVPSRGGYGKERVPFMRTVIDKAIQTATQVAVSKVIAEEQQAIEAAVRENLRAKVDEFATSMVQDLADAASNTRYRINVDVKGPRD